MRTIISVRQIPVLLVLLLSLCAESVGDELQDEWLQFLEGRWRAGTAVPFTTRIPNLESKDDGSYSWIEVIRIDKKASSKDRFKLLAVYTGTKDELWIWDVVESELVGRRLTIEGAFGLYLLGFHFDSLAEDSAKGEVRMHEGRGLFGSPYSVVRVGEAAITRISEDEFECTFNLDPAKMGWTGQFYRKGSFSVKYVRQADP